MKQLIAAEQFMQLILCIIAFNFQPIHITWWVWPFLFLSPDLSMIGYLVNTKVGAVTYNIAHHKAVAGILIIIGTLIHLPVILFMGILLWAHSSFDRMMGYGLKYGDSFQHTHLGMVGKKKE